MIPIKMRISGFLSYQEPVELNFESFDLACITGSNGAGKSSLLDALTWVLFGEARRRDDTVINDQSKAAEVELTFDYENNRYRILRSKPKEKTAVLEFSMLNQDGTWKVLTEPTLRGTEDTIRQILRMDYETFINASFFLQGKADQFAQQRPSDRKRILANILGLDVWETYKEEAARRRRNCELDLANVEGFITDIENELNEEAARREQLARAEKDYSGLKKLLDSNKKLLDQQRLLQDRVQNEQRQLEKQFNEITRLRVDLDSQKDRFEQRQQEQVEYRAEITREKEIRAEFQTWQEARQALEKWESLAENFHQYEKQRSGPLLEIETEKNRLQLEIRSLQTSQKRILDLEESLPELKHQRDSFQKEVDDLSRQIEQRPILEEQLRNLQDEKARANADNLRLKSEMTELKERISRLTETIGAVCPLCEKPLTPKEREKLIDDLNKRGKEMGDAYRRNQVTFDQCEKEYRKKETELIALQRQDAALKLQQRLLDGKQSEITAVEKETADWRKKEEPRLRELSQRLEKNDYALDARSRLTEVDVNLRSLGYDAIEHESRRQAELAHRTSQEKLLGLEKAISALVPLEREISNLEESLKTGQKRLADLEAEHTAAQKKLDEETAGSPDLKELEKEYYDTQEQVNQALRAVGYARNQVDVLDVQRRQLSSRKDEKNAINTQIANLRTLERAFGKDGIPALLIEQALPEIEIHANDILDRLSSGEMSISFSTQRDYKNKKREDRKETLDIYIQDAAGRREYELFSGGEAFRINFALRLALSRVLSRRAGARLQTLVIDEGFGSQDTDGRQRLVEAINLVRPEFAKIMVITHLEELKDAFPARIEVTKTPKGSQVEVVSV